MARRVRGYDSQRLAAMTVMEECRFVERHQRCQEAARRSTAHLFDGVPMNWMTRWASPFPLFVERAEGSSVTCLDGHRHSDFCLGDTGAMAGHSPRATVAAVRAQLDRGLTHMLPSEDGPWVAEELARRFGLRYWQVAMTASDANRFALRLARHITRRPKILVFNWCYHGSVAETIATLSGGVPCSRPGSCGPAIDPSCTTKVVEFNDVAALRRALLPRDVACVLAEPALTNIGIVLPEEGFHDALRAITRETGTLLILDETHTICAGAGGCTRAWSLEPDMVTIGKPIGGGIPCAAYGIHEKLEPRIRQDWDYHAADVGGVGGTLAGNALQLAAMRATLADVLTEESYAQTVPLATRFCRGVQEIIDDLRLSWVVKQLGCRAEYWPASPAPVNGGEAAAAEDPALDRFLHLFALNRGVLLTPFHNMALMAPSTTAGDVDRHTEVLREATTLLYG